MNFPPLMYDATFDAWRDASGHRVTNGDGSPVRQTRELALRKPWLAPLELWHRYIARTAIAAQKALQESENGHE